MTAALATSPTRASARSSSRRSPGWAACSNRHRQRVLRTAISEITAAEIVHATWRSASRQHPNVELHAGDDDPCGRWRATSATTEVRLGPAGEAEAEADEPDAERRRRSPARHLDDHRGDRHAASGSPSGFYAYGEDSARGHAGSGSRSSSRGGDVPAGLPRRRHRQLRGQQERAPRLLQRRLQRLGQERPGDPGFSTRTCSVHVLYRDLSMLKDEHAQVEAAKKRRHPLPALSRRPLPRARSDRRRATGAPGARPPARPGAPRCPPTCSCSRLGFQRRRRRSSRGQGSPEGLRRRKDGFFQEAHPKLGPLDFPVRWHLALAGCAKLAEVASSESVRGRDRSRDARVHPDEVAATSRPTASSRTSTSGSASHCGLCSRKRCPYGADPGERRGRAGPSSRPSARAAACASADCPKSHGMSDRPLHRRSSS